MFAVLVDFIIADGMEDKFHDAIQAHAKNSREKETGCLLFDACVNPESPHEVFLYELYTDEAAFKAHQASEHFAQFEERAGAWITSKTVRLFTKLES
ncbi:putative quinol monooxygenase [Terasakiella sp. SH-1]|uniref:putative quinol monooxygenase n=1 Tax=Terasakiella sp. SH-1 TaxID=2560057 RepID=UPI001073B784|nr:putative quinol monooxygenase [Terasakiella sp. SH-1]